MSIWEDQLNKELAELSTQSLTRIRHCITPANERDPSFSHILVGCKPYTAFSSNDYLGLAHHPILIQAACQSARSYGVGSGASPMISGYSKETSLLEQELSDFVGMPSALYFYAGFSTNSSIIPALMSPQDAIFIDKLSHACLIDGALLSRARLFSYPNCDLTRLEVLLQKSNHPKKLVVSDAVFSMDGHIAPIKELVELCEQYGAYLLLDDAHGFGVLGESGKGSLYQTGFKKYAIPSHVIYMATLGKAAGCAGAFVAGSPTIIQYLSQKTRSYIFATAAPTMLSAVLRASLKIITEAQDKRAHLQCLITHLREGLTLIAKKNNWQLLPSSTPIQALVVGASDAALRLMTYLEQSGFWVPAIRPPTVPDQTARLRIALSSSHTQSDITNLLTVLSAFADFNS